MLTHWVLFIMLFGPGSETPPALTNAEFNDMTSCEQAAQLVNTEFTVKGRNVRTVCVPQAVEHIKSY
jgi:hypothetical protein